MNNMRSSKEKEKIVKYYMSGHSLSETKKKYNIEHAMTFYRWLRKYQENGLESLQSKTGKKTGGNKGIGNKKPKNKIWNAAKFILLNRPDEKKIFKFVDENYNTEAGKYKDGSIKIEDLN